MDKWDLRFIKIAREVSDWSKDPNRKVGSVIVKDRRILSTGYNGFPTGFPDDYTLNTPDKNLYVVHAEVNAIANSKQDLSGSTIYVSGLHPCSQCAALIVQAGIKRVVYDYEPSNDSSWKTSVESAKNIFKKCGIKCECSLPSIIMIGGKKRSGKSWVASHLDLPVVAFADVPKLMFKSMFGIEFDSVKTDPRPLYGGLSAREFIQRFATEACQGYLGKTIWRDLLIEKLQAYKTDGIDAVVISDWRFKHEIIPGAKKVYVIDKLSDDDQHQSENDINQDDADIVLDNTHQSLSITDLAQIV